MNLKVYSANNGTSTPGTLERGEGQTAIGDAHVDTNYDMLGRTYACYQTLFGRDSYDNAGATLTSTVHSGSNYVNAYWDGTQMVYGDGNGTDSIELGKDLDVTVHEWRAGEQPLRQLRQQEVLRARGARGSAEPGLRDQRGLG